MPGEEPAIVAVKRSACFSINSQLWRSDFLSPAFRICACEAVAGRLVVWRRHNGDFILRHPKVRPGKARRDRLMNAARTDNTVHRMAQVIAASGLPLAHATAIRAALREHFSPEQVTVHLAEAINRARTHRTVAGGLPPTWGHF
jgi:hypothetical protein